MDRDLIQEFLEQSGMRHDQASALSHIFAEMATKSDLSALKSDMRAELAGLEARLTWRIIATVVFLSTVITLLHLFVD